MALIKRSKKEQQESDIQGSAAPAHTMPVNFLGALTLNVASATKLHPVFQSIMDGSREVREALLNGVVNEREAAVRLSQLKARDNRGALWTVGLQSLMWYKRIGNSKWVSSPSPFGSSEDGPISPWYVMTDREGSEHSEKTEAALDGSGAADSGAPIVKSNENPAVLSQWRGEVEDESRDLATLVKNEESEGAEVKLEGAEDAAGTSESFDDLLTLLRSSGMGKSSSEVEDFSSTEGTHLLADNPDDVIETSLLVEDMRESVTPLKTQAPVASDFTEELE